MKFKSDIEIQAGIKDKDGQIGGSGQILASTGSQVDWIDQSDIISASSKLVVIACKNTSGATITKGTPVYQTGTVGATDVIEIAKADASDENKMAAIGLLQTDLINNEFGNVVITGELLNLITSPIDGATPTTGDTIYVKPGGGLTLTKPTGINFIQNVGLIGKVSTGNSGSITVSSIMRSNDVPTPLYIDHTNQRLGIGATSPSEKLEVDGDVKISRTDNTSSVLTIDTNRSFGRDFTITNNGQEPHINATDILKITADGGDAGIRIDASGQDYISFTTQTSERVRIDPLGNVGIGTTSPSEKLDVLGNIKLRTSEGNTTNKLIPTNYNGNSALKIKGGNYVHRLFFETDWNDFEYASIESSYNTSESFFNLNKSNSTGGVSGTTRISTGNSYFNGNVGLGFTSPPYKLSTKVDSNDTYAYYVANSLGSNRGGIYVDSNGHTRFLGRTGAGTTVQISASGTSYLNGGNVGIGTTSPDYALHVDPTVKIGDRQGTDGSLILQSQQGPNITFTSTGDNLDISGSTGSSNGNTIRLLDEIKVFEFHANIGGTIRINRGNRGLMDTNIGGYVVQQQNTTSSNGKSTFLSTDSSGTILRSTSYGGTGTSGDIQFQFGGGNNTSEPAPATKVIIKNDGKVGIGTASPSTNLEIVTSDPSNGIKLTTNTGNLWGTLLNTNSNAFPVGKLALRFGTSETASITARSNEMRIGGSQMNLTLYTSSSEKFRVDTNGNVGIGTTSPGTKLHVQGAASGYLFRVQGTSTLNVYDPGAAAEIGVGSGPGDKLKLFSNDSINNGITIDTSGNVGIGTTSPTYILDVVSSGTATARLKSAGTGAISLRYENGGGFKSAAVVDNNGLYRLDATNISLNPTSNVGVGTTSPSEKLHVDGNVLSSGDFISGSPSSTRIVSSQTLISGYYAADTSPRFAIGRDVFGGGKAGIALGGNGGFSYVGTDSTNGDKLIFSTNGSNTLGQGATYERMRIDGSGNVGIGTTSPSSILDINGGSANGVSIQAANVGTEYVLHAKTSNGTSRFWVGGDGTVGIGTTSPTEKLHIDDGDVIVKNDSTNQYKWQYGSNQPTWSVGGGNYFTIKGGSTRFVTLNSSGNFGIGTTSPTSKFQVSANNGDGITLKHGASNAFYILRDGNDDTIIKQTRNYTSKISISTLADSGTHESSGLNIVGQGVGLKSNVGIGTASPVYKLDVDGGARAGGVITYSKSAGSLDTTGYAVAGLTSSSNGNSTGFTFTCFGNTGDYQKIVYSCYNALGTWKTKKVIDEGTNDFDIAASADGSTITFTFKSTSGTKNYTPRVTVEAVGSAINSTYA